MDLPDELCVVESYALSAACPRLENLRRDNSIPDLTIQGKDGGIVLAHRIILAARFPNLTESLLGDPCANNTKLIWPRAPSNIIERVVSFAYTGRITLTVNNVHQIYLMAISLRSAVLVKFCINFIIPRISLTNLEQTWPIALHTNSEALKFRCISVMEANFEAIVNTHFFSTLNVEVVEDLLRSDRLMVEDEESKFRAIFTWIGEGADDRKTSYLPKLVDAINLMNLSSDFIVDQMIAKPLIYNNVECRIMLSTSGRAAQARFYAVGIPSAPTIDDHLAVIQVHPIIGREVVIGQLSKRSGPTIGHFQGNLWVAGDRTYDRENEPMDLIENFKLDSRTVQSTASLNERKCYFTAVASPYEIVICGGYSDKSLDTCKVYKSADDSWINLPEMQEARCLHGMVWLPNGAIFAIGGWRAGNDLSSVEMMVRPWDPSLTVDQVGWRYVAPMQIARRASGCALFGSNIIVAGGHKGPKVTAVNLSCVEMFAPPEPNEPDALGQWTSIRNLSSPVKTCFLVVSAGLLFAVGEDGMIQQFQPPNKEMADAKKQLETWSWKPLTALKTISTCYGAVFLK